MQSKATTVKQYLSELPDDRRVAIEAVRDVILKNLNPGFEEGMQYGMIGFYVPHRIYPAGYHCNPKEPVPFVCLASQKNYMSLYMMSAYMNPEDARWLQREWAKTGKRLDMGKCCIRFKKLADLPLDLIGQLIRRVTIESWIATYERVIAGARKSSPRATTKKGAKHNNVKAAKAAKKKGATTKSHKAAPRKSR